MAYSTAITAAGGGSGTSGRARAAALTHTTFLARLCYELRLAVLGRSAFSTPGSLSDAAARFRRNFVRSPINYLVALIVIGHPTTLLFVVAWLQLYVRRPSYSPPIAVDSRAVSDKVAWAALTVLFAVLSGPIIFRSMFWLAVLSHVAALVVVIAHGVFCVPEDPSLGDQGRRGDGLLRHMIKGWIGGGLYSFCLLIHMIRNGSI